MHGGVRACTGEIIHGGTLDGHEAKTILSGELERLRRLSYDELVARFLSRQETVEVVGPSGAQYQVQLQADWDDDPAGNLRVVAAIHDGGWRRFLPLAQVFVRAPDGSFVGE